MSADQYLDDTKAIAAVLGANERWSGADKSAFDHAVETARQSIPIQRMVVRPECLSDYTITEHPPGRFSVYNTSAWEAPTETPMLPWAAPTGTPVAIVKLDGTVCFKLINNKGATKS